MAFLVLLCGIAFAQGDEGSDQASMRLELSAAPEAPNGPELVGKRTATSETFRLPSGQLETRIYQAPIHYRDAENHWQPIEEGLEPGPGASIVNSESNRFDVSLPVRLGSAPVRVSEEGEWVSYRLLGRQTDPVELDEAQASYEVEGNGPQFDFETIPNGVKEEIEVTDPSQPTNFRFELDASEGVTPELAQDGSVQFRDAAGGLRREDAASHRRRGRRPAGLRPRQGHL